MTSIMAVNSHGDSQYDLLIDTVNNNSSKSILSSSLNDKTKCSIFPFISASLDPSRAGSGSSRRKCCTLSKGITIEEFLKAGDSYQQTPIDKLLWKNKIALAQDQMKRTKVKSLKESVTTQNKEFKKNGGKVVCSKITAKRKIIENRVMRSLEASECNGNKIIDVVENGFGSVVFRDAFGPSKKLASAPKNGKNTKTEFKKKLSDTVRNDRNDRRLIGGNSLLKMRSFKKESRSNSMKSKPLELKRLKTCLNYQTRSGNKERLRSGKLRIIKDVKDTLVSPKTTKRLKNENEMSVPVPDPAVNRNSLKRPIKAEPLDDGWSGLCDKRRKLERSSDSGIGSKCGDCESEGDSEKNGYGTCKGKDLGNQVGNISRMSLYPGISVRVSDSSNVNKESEVRVKKEKNEYEDSNVVRINVNMSLPHLLSTGLRANMFESAAKNIRKDCISRIGSGSESGSSNSTILKELSSASNRHETTASNIEPSAKNDLNSLLSSSTVFVNACTKKTVHSCFGDKENGLKSATPAKDETLSTFNSVPVKSTGDCGLLDEKSRFHSSENNNLTKESIFNALGLQSIEKINQKSKEKEMKDKENYTGTLKAIIKIDKGCRKIEMKQQERNSVRSEVKIVLSR